MNTTIHVWRCDGCGEMLPGPDLDLDMAKCKCKTGQWRVCCVAATIGESAERARKAEQERDAARAELARLTTPRPIAEAPRTNSTQIIALWMDGDVVESMDVVVWADMDDGDHPERKFWMNMAGDSVEHMTHYLPLPEVKP